MSDGEMIDEFRRAVPRLLRFVIRQMPSTLAGSMRPADVVRDAFRAAAMDPWQLRAEAPDGVFRSLARIALNHLIEHLRERRRTARAPAPSQRWWLN